MKLLILSTVYPRGEKELPGRKVHGKFIRDLAKAWIQAGHEVHVLTPHSINTLTLEKLDGVYVHRFHYFFRESWETLTYGDGIPQNIKKFKNKLLVPFLAFGFWWNGLKLVRKYRIDAVNAHWAIPTGYIALWIKAFTKTKLVTTVYGAELFPMMAGKMQMLIPFLQRAINGADVVAGISQTTVETAKTLSGCNDIHLIPDGIDIDYYKPGPKNKNMLNKYQCSGPKVIFFTGRMVERKGHRYLLEAMKYVSQKHADTKLILGGKGPLFDKLLALRVEWELQNIVEMPGFLPEEDMVPLLQSTDVFILPSCIDQYGDTEGSATAALEAMACGTPAVISKVGGNIGAIVDGKGAFYSAPNNARDLAEKIIHIFKQSEMTTELSDAARDHILQHYAWATIVRQYHSLIAK